MYMAYIYICIYIYTWDDTCAQVNKRPKVDGVLFLGARLENFRRVSIQDACFLNGSRLDGGPKAIPIAVHTNLGHSSAVGLCSIGQSLHIVDFRTFPLYMFAMYSIYSYASYPVKFSKFEGPPMMGPPFS